MRTNLKNLFRYRTLINILIVKELKTRYRGSILGFFWSLLNPLSLMLVYTIVFSIFMRVQIEHYPLFMLSALLPWIWLSSSLSEGVNAVVSGAPLLKKAAFPPEVLPAVKVLSNLVNYLLSIPTLILLLYFAGIHQGNSFMFIPIFIILEGIFIMGLTFMVSALNVLFRDVQYIVNNLLTIWFFMTPVAYPLTQVPGKFVWFLYLNPMTTFSKGYQDIFFYRQTPSFTGLFFLTVLSLTIFWAGYTVFNRLKHIFIEEI